MTARLTLALAIHNHQPVGNFGWVYEGAYRQAYLPFVEALERHPAIRLSLHYTGPLLAWLRAAQPGFLERVVALARAGRVELMGGGHYEPVLVALPERDRVGQLRRMADELERLSGRRPAGAWLAERVWEPSLPSALADAGYAWTIVDDVHFRAASIPADAAWGPYSTDDQGRRVDVFATDQRLRYSIPFAEPETVLEYLRSLASEDGARLATMGDDGEKFGSWPRTYEHCWGADRWVERFFEALEEAADWLALATPTEWLDGHAPLGRAYIPTASYIEMTEWALPPDESIAFEQALARATAADAPEARWLRGGFWRNYQARYREINDLHKAMLRASDRVASMPPGPLRDLAIDHLYQGQSNDTYWHGVFGGVYINHLRLATWEHVIAAADLARAAHAPDDGDAAEGAASAHLLDVDLDGRDEALLESDAQTVVVDLAEGAGIGEWDLHAPRHAIAAVMRRRPEAAHLKLLEAERSRSSEGPADGGDAAADTEAAGDDVSEQSGDDDVASIHELALVKEEGLAARIAYDQHERRSALVHVLDPALTQEGFGAADFTELGDFVDEAFAVRAMEPGMLRVGRDGSVLGNGGHVAVGVEKVVHVEGSRDAPVLGVDVALRNDGGAPISALLGLGFALNLLGGGANPQAYYRVGGTRSPHDGSGAVDEATNIDFGNDWLGIEARADVHPAARIWWQPIETVSSSEGGFERNYQGSDLLFGWPLELAPGASIDVSVRITLRCRRDRRAEELAGMRTPSQDASTPRSTDAVATPPAGRR